MNYLKHIIVAASALLAVSVSMHTYAYTVVPEEMVPEDAAEPDMSAVAPVTVGDVTYLSGGIGKSESVAMRGSAKKLCTRNCVCRKVWCLGRVFIRG